MSERDAYEQKIKAKLKEWDAQIDKLQARAEGAGADAKLDYERQLKELKAARDAAGDKLRELRNAGAENWLKLRHERIQYRGACPGYHSMNNNSLEKGQRA